MLMPNNKKLKQIDIEQADALASMKVRLWCRRVYGAIRWDSDAFSVLPSGMNKIRTDSGQLPLTFLAEVDE